jgi:hypothetical protein
MKVLKLFPLLLLSACSLFGVQSEEQPKYKVLVQDGDFEIREYAPYIVASVTVKGDFKKSQGKAFRILAGYIFGKNKGEKKIAMTSPVEMKNEPAKIAMTSPVEMSQNKDSFMMSFSMPSKYNLKNLPTPEDKRIVFKEVPSKIVATHQFSWYGSQSRNDSKAKELRSWLKKHKNYKQSSDYSYAGYNPPWTLPFFRRNEIQIVLKK